MPVDASEPPLERGPGADLEKRLATLLDSEKLGVLSTCGGQQPYASLVAFSATEDLAHLVFVTPRPTRKYANLMANARVAILVDNRSRRASDFRRAMAETAVGTVRDLRKTKNSRLVRIYLEKHPRLEDFVRSPTCAVLALRVESYYVVERFQHVSELRPKRS
jgi:nitroimidazol reductase NimA-like FMN-containing flavoprotein (pyridoxamine 5'-phosphate oxidase superfamily)